MATSNYSLQYESLFYPPCPMKRIHRLAEFLSTNDTALTSAECKAILELINKASWEYKKSLRPTKKGKKKK